MHSEDHESNNYNNFICIALLKTQFKRDLQSKIKKEHRKYKNNKQKMCKNNIEDMTLIK